MVAVLAVDNPSLLIDVLIHYKSSSCRYCLSMVSGKMMKRMMAGLKYSEVLFEVGQNLWLVTVFVDSSVKDLQTYWYLQRYYQIFYVFL